MQNNQSYYGSTERKRTAQVRDLLLDGTARVLNGWVHYRMYQLVKNGEVLYRLCTTYAGTRAECCVRCNRSFADKLFFTLLRGRVTPCSMVYIVCELVENSEYNVIMEV